MKKWSFKTGDLLKEVQFMCPFKTGDCLTEVTTWTGLTVLI